MNKKSQKISPILFSSEMVRAIISGNKTMTRRIVKPMPRIANVKTCNTLDDMYSKFADLFPHPYGKPGDLLWVRENYRYCQPFGPESLNYQFIDNATGESVPDETCYKIIDYEKWRPSIHLPKTAARIWLQILNVRIERLKQISKSDAKAEGIKQIDPTKILGGTCPVYYNYLNNDTATDNPVASFYSLWESINGINSWDANPWVWVVEFEVLTINGWNCVPEKIRRMADVI
ncbi:hypothetical protein [Pedobacter sp. KBW01]|uniref:hypothetical protein n=1 Tax=Pedobacter sp. KBW01 TaxID=2153364 RepID=UPI0018F65F91|nr:hypothetical protein [Pedobacter sp. KBW01]